LPHLNFITSETLATVEMQFRKVFTITCQIVQDFDLIKTFEIITVVLK